jgi:hypothetical protein
MMGNQQNAMKPSKEEVRSYLGDMLEELAIMAERIEDHRTSEALRAAVKTADAVRSSHRDDDIKA